MHGEALADDGAPAAGAESDQVLLLLPAGAEEALLQDEFGMLEVRGGVDALNFILIVELVIGDPEAGADELMDTVGQPVFAIDGRRR